MKLEREIDDLYALPLSDFVKARNALVKRLKSSGAKGEAERVRRLAKPSQTAWAVNRLWHAERSRMEALVAAGDDLRSALEEGADTAAPVAARRQRSAELLRLAVATLEDAGRAAGPEARRRISRTLETLANRGSSAEGRPGRWVDDLEPSGFDLLGGLSLPKGSTSIPPEQPAAAVARSPVTKPEKKGASASARAALARRRAALTRKVDLATTVEARAGRRADDSRHRLESARRLLAGTREKVEQLRNQLEREQIVAQEREESVAEAVAADEAAQHRLADAAAALSGLRAELDALPDEEL